ncbi:DUF4097 family beta strand repeat-containing protein [Streptomyces sp. NPDC004647]|uniref:DUF4097 family beta strand repeat-containing protein n=1 Tax=Streptomyces sp. NPDC004647 TaxID=3154671 RepID=UPI0033A3027F
MALRTRTILASGGVLVLAAVTTGCGGAEAAEDRAPEHRAFAFSGRTLTVDTENSDIELVPADVEKVEVTRWFSGWTAVGGDVEQTWEMKGDTLRLEVGCGGLINNCDARHRVEVPRGVAVTVEDDNGTVRASGFDTGLKLSSGNGTVRVEDSRGPLELSSDNGQVTATGVASRRVSADSDNGEVQLAFTQVPDQVETTSDNGEIHIELPRASYRVEAQSSNGETDVGVPQDDRSGHSVTAHSDNGEVTLRTAN